MSNKVQLIDASDVELQIAARHAGGDERGLIDDIEADQLSILGRARLRGFLTAVGKFEVYRANEAGEVLF